MPDDFTQPARPQRGVTLAIATGKSEAGLWRVLDKLGLRDRFAVCRTAEKTRAKPDPLMLREVLDELSASPEDAVMVGDSTFDIDMAHAAGVRSIAVTYGAHGRHRLAKSRPTAWASRFPDLLHLLAG